MTEGNKDIIVQVDKIGKDFYVNYTQESKSSLKVLQDISFSLRRGDSMALIGRNGSGKSTLLKILSNIIKPSSGKIFINGSFTSILEVGNGFHPELTGRENIYLYHSLISPDTKPNEEKIISFAELSDYIDMPVKFYSNGMYLRLAFSVAIHAEADLLLLDEVLAVGDSTFMNKCYQKIVERRNEGCSFIIASHNMSDILKLCNKGIWIKMSEMKYCGNIGDAVSAYLRDMYVDVQLKPTYQIKTTDVLGFLAVNEISVYSGKSSEKAEFSFEDQITISILLESFIDNNVVYPVIEVENESGSIVAILGSISWQLPKLEIGEYQLKLQIPRMLLNIGVYKINIRILKKDLGDILYFKNALVFRIIQKDPDLNVLQQANPFHIVSGESTWEITKS